MLYEELESRTNCLQDMHTFWDNMAEVLKNPPLAEAILELKWTPTTGNLGKYLRANSSFGERFKFIEQLDALSIPDDVQAHLFKLRFREKQNGWPLFQIGNGICSINFVNNYSWDSFFDVGKDLYENIKKVYMEEGGKFSLTGIQLKYINTIELAFAKKDILEFLKTKMHTEIKFPDAIRNGKAITAGLNLRLGYETDSPKSLQFVTISSGMKQGVPCVVFQIEVNSFKDLPANRDQYLSWIESAHEAVEKWFFVLIEGDLKKSFETGVTQ